MLILLVNSDTITKIMHIDHLIVGAPSLKAGADYIESLLGQRPTYGGQHPGLGTHNTLLAFGPDSYLEIIAPDPAQPDVPRPLWIDAARLTEPRLFRWAAKSDKLPDLCRRASAAGLPLGEVLPGSRQRPDGQLLSWQLTDPRIELEGGLLPFFVDWGDSVHPAQGLPSAGRLVELYAEHPQPERLRQQAEVLGLELRVIVGAVGRLRARIATEGGVVEL
ncbi:MAG: VOC family protein [Bacteroidota bacterium]